MADKRIDQLVAATTVGDDDLLVLQQNNQAKKLSGKKLGDYVYAAAAGKVAEVEQAVADAQSAIDDLEEQKDTIAQAVAAMADLGTDMTLTTPGMAADAKATGDKIEETKEIVNSLFWNGAAGPGSVIVVTDAADSSVKNIKLSAPLHQDFHGQNGPYPAGAMKNLIVDGTDMSNGYESNSYLKDDGTTATSTLFYISEYFEIEEGETYTYSTDRETSVSASVCFYDSSKQFISGQAITSAHVVTVYAPEGAVYCRASQTIPSTGDLFQFEKGESATDLFPYSNICEIDMWTNVRINSDSMHAGTINFNQRYAGSGTTATASGVKYTNNSDGTWTLTGQGTATNRKQILTLDPPLIPGHYYVMRHNADINGSSSTFGVVLSINGSYLTPVYSKNGLRLYANYEFNQFSIRTFSGFKSTDGVVITPQLFDLTNMFGAGNEPSLEEFNALFPKKYYPYNSGTIATVSEINGNPYSSVNIAIPEEAKTLYGFTLNINEDGTGQLIKRYRELSISSCTFTKISSSDYRTFSTVPSLEAPIKHDVAANTVFSTHYKPVCNNNGSTTTGDNYIWSWNNNGESNIAIKDTARLNLTAEQYKQWLIDNDVKIVYELKYPQIYDLTQQQVLTLVQGKNYIWADGADILEFSYRKLPVPKEVIYNTIENIIADVEETPVATRNYTSGSRVILDHVLYRVTDPIVVGESLRPSENISVVTIDVLLDELGSTVNSFGNVAELSYEIVS